ncbi:MAG: hypothetical protein ACOH19_04625 [Rhodoglobus sp.]
MTSATDQPSDYLVIGKAPRPTSGAELDERLRGVLKQMAADSTGAISGLDSAKVESVIDGADVAQLALDFTGVRIGLDGGTSTGSAYESFGIAQTVEQGVVREFHVRANPVTFQGVDVVIDGSVAALRFQWAVDEKGRLGVGPSDEGNGRLRIQLHAETNQDALVAAATELLETQLSEAGVTVSDVDVDLQSVGPREARVVASAKIRKGILGASATFRAHATIDDQMVLCVTEPQLSSRNPIVAGLLLVTRDRITQAVASPIDLNASLPDGLHLQDVTLDLSERIRVDLQFG